MPLSDFANVDVDEIVDKLTVDEAILLTAGVGSWHTHAVPRLGIPAIKVSDGPNGIRGNYYFMATPAKCLPCSTALGATWDPELIEEVGLKLIAKEAKLRAAPIVLAPTCNIQRNPLGGRSFESFSEDPHLSGMLAAAYVRGVQKGGIGAAIKHFVCNDKENDRRGYDSVVSERALREIYLMPFMLAQKYAKPWCFMTSYNRVNGTHVSENEYLLQDILRKEWGFDGLIMSDWYGVYSIDLSLNAGLDLEMPGVNKWRTLNLVNRAIAARKTTVRTVKERARKVIELAKRVAQESPDILDGDGVERTVESEEDKELMRKLAAESIVLLKNDNNVLPLRPDTLKKVAIIGGNAKAIVLSGGGSASLKPSYFISPFDGIKDALGPQVEVTYSEGASTYMEMPTLDFEILTPSGDRGWIGSWYSHESDDSMVALQTPILTRTIDETRVFFSTYKPEGITKRWSMRLEGRLKPRPYDCSFEFGLTVAGRAKLYVDGVLVIDNWTRQRRALTFFSSGSQEERGVVVLTAHTSPTITVEYCNVRAPADGDEDEMVLYSNPGVRLGGAEVLDPDVKMARAIEIAREADVVIAVVGLNGEWETEAYDRTTLALAGRTDELIFKVAAVNPRVVVVTEAGSAIAMPWMDMVPSILHSWYLGNATGLAMADVLFGYKNPSGKLPLTFPWNLKQVPSHGYFHSENGKVYYGEDLHVGYKYYQHSGISPMFKFGFGLSYTSFECSRLQVTSVKQQNHNFEIVVDAQIKNIGSYMGTEVAQLFISMPENSALSHPPQLLQAFHKVKDLQCMESREVHFVLDKHAVSHWEEHIQRWVVEPGKYTVLLRLGSQEKGTAATFSLIGRLEWNGL